MPRCSESEEVVHRGTGERSLLAFARASAVSSFFNLIDAISLYGVQALEAPSVVDRVEALLPALCMQCQATYPFASGRSTFVGSETGLEHTRRGTFHDSRRTLEHVAEVVTCCSML